MESRASGSPQIIPSTALILRRATSYILWHSHFRAFVKEVMEKQEFPVRHYTPGGDVIRPYDVTSWSLPLHRGIVSYEISSS